LKKKKIQKTNAMRQLEKGKIDYTIHEYAWNEDHLDAGNTAEQVSVPLEKIYKTMVVTGNQTGEIVACIPAESKLDLKKLAAVSGNKKVDMLKIRDLEKTTGYIRGGCSPVGMKRQFPTYIEAGAEALDTIVVSAGKRGMQMELSPDELIQITEGTYADMIL